MTEKNLKSSEDEIVILALLKEFWKSRKTIIKITTLFFFLGLFVAIFSEDQYTSSTTFVPLVQGGVSAGGLGSLASLAGINLGAGVNNEEISPELYPQIVKSIPFQLELMNTPLSIEGQSTQISYYEYYKNIYKQDLLSNIKKYTIGLPSLLISLVSSDEEIIDKQATENKIITLSYEEYSLIELLETQLNLDINDKEGFISISVTLPEAKASAELALKAQQLLQRYVLNLKTQKSISQLNYIKDRYVEKENEFNSVKISLARFQDQNKTINTALARTKLLQLQVDYDLAFTVYSELAKQLETQQLQVKKDTPLFTVLKPVSIPLDKSAPKTLIIIVVYLFLGFALSLGVILGKKYFKSLKKEWILKKNE